MALVIDQESNFKHFCKICKKGFLCGRALGGHMRAHGIGDESITIDDDDDQASDWEDKLDDDDIVPPSKKRMYALRTNLNRLKSCRVCENCGKEFSSWKSFLEHGKCSSEDAESLFSSPGSYGDIGIGRTTCGWSKRKRSFRAQVGHLNSNFSSTEEDDFAANCLMMLSNAATVDRSPTVAEPEESCASASKDEERRANPLNFISSLSCKNPTDHNKVKGVAKVGLFECKACKKVFNSHQALGGHRASHKKVKGCFAAKLDQIEDSLPDDDDVITHEEFFPAKPNPALGHDSNAQLVSTSKRKSKVHECSICHRVFSSGQALGGHKRCHWITSNAPDASTLARFQQLQEQLEHMNQTPKFDAETLDLKLDLNLPAPGDQEIAGDRRKETTEVYLQSWVEKKEANEDVYHQIHNDNNEDKTNKKNNTSLQNVDDEADSTVKLAKLSQLKDMNFGGNSTAWLQVGIASTDGVGTDTKNFTLAN